ncbi:MAG: diaminopimelate decarboxylase, partial [Bacteroidota bacterium]
MTHFIPLTSICQSYKKCVDYELINPDIDTTVIFYDFNVLQSKVDDLHHAFPPNTVHTSAIKASPLIKVLEKVKQLNLGAEVASEGELFLAQKAGFNNHQIIFDSPAKTNSELEFALKNHIHINADSLMELCRIAELKNLIKSQSLVGLRINPQVGTGKIAATSLAGEYSKFGVPIKHYRDEIIDYFKMYDWLNGIHMHIGSQGCEMQLLLNGIEKGLHLINDINKALQHENRAISFFDIGGGLPVSYHHNQEPPDIKVYGKEIKKLLKKYKLEKLNLITEFGRYLHVNSGYILTKVEYTKYYPNDNTLIVHAGADLLLRECLNPGQWYHEISLLDNDGNPKKSASLKKYHIAGPLCFANDIVARSIELPEASEGDFLVIHDTGGYTYGMWSKYVSRMFPKIIGKENNEYSIIKKRETVEDIYRFW